MAFKNSTKTANLKMLQFMATKLGDLCNSVVFVGGCTTALFITEQHVPDVRYTLDVDCIIDVISLNQYHKFEKQLSQHGFTQSLTEDVICRWFFDDMILDVMPTDEKILGFSNCWYKDAIKYSLPYSLTSKLNINVVSAPYFLATKLEAFKTRGKMDYYASHDFEDIVTVLDGRIEIVEEIRQSNKNLREYLIETFRTIHGSRAFQGAIGGHFIQYGQLADNRIELLEQKIKAIITE